MAKGSQFWGNASGKLGEQVLYRAGGEQRARMYVAKIKNPKTRAQMANRVLMNNMVSMFRSVRNILSQSFPNRPSNQSGFNAFVSANKNVNMFAIDKSMLEANACVPYGMTISKGTSGIVLSSECVSVINPQETDAPARYAWELKGLNLATDEIEMTGEQYEGITALTPQQLYTLFVGDTNPLGLPSEFTLTILGAQWAGDEEDFGEDVWQLGGRQYVCRADGGNGNSRFGFKYGNTFFDIEAEILTDKPDDDTKPFKVKVGRIFLGSGKSSAEQCLDTCYGLILSYKSEKGLQVSTSVMSPAKPYTDDDTEVPIKPYALEFAPGGEIYEEILSNIGYNSDSTL